MDSSTNFSENHKRAEIDDDLWTDYVGDYIAMWQKNSSQFIQDQQHKMLAMAMCPFLFGVTLNLPEAWIKLLYNNGVLEKDRTSKRTSLSREEMEMSEMAEVLFRRCYHLVESKVDLKTILNYIYEVEERSKLGNIDLNFAQSELFNKEIFKSMWAPFRKTYEHKKKQAYICIIYFFKTIHQHCVFYGRNGLDKADFTKRLIAERNKLKKESYIEKDSTIKLGNTAFKEGNFKQALELYSAVLELEPLNSQLYSHRAQTNLQLNNLWEAYCDNKRARLLDRSSSNNYFQAAKLYIEFKQLDKAEEMNKMALRYVRELDIKESILTQAQEIEEAKKIIYLRKTVIEKGKENEPPQVPLDEFNKHLNSGIMYYNTNKHSKAISFFHKALSLISQFGQEEINVTSDDVLVIKFVYSMSCIYAGSNILSAVEHLKSILEVELFPAAYYALGVSSLALHSYKEAESYLSTGLNVLNNYDGKSFLWPHSIQIVPETDTGKLAKLFQEKLKECGAPKPDGLCRFHFDVDPNDKKSVEIYKQAPDYKGSITIQCTAKCQIDFHKSCWKIYKQKFGDKITDKEMLDLKCPTPECWGTVNVIHIISSSSEAKKLSSSDVKEKLVGESKPKKEKQEKDNVDKIFARRVERKAKQKRTAEKYSTERDSATRELEKVSDGATCDIVASPDLSYMTSQEVTNFMAANVVLLKKDDDDELLAGAKQKFAVKNKKKKEKFKFILPVDVQFAEDQEREKNRISAYDEVEENVNDNSVGELPRPGIIPMRLMPKPGYPQEDILADFAKEITLPKPAAFSWENLAARRPSIELTDSKGTIGQVDREITDSRVATGPVDREITKLRTLNPTAKEFKPSIKRGGTYDDLDSIELGDDASKARISYYSLDEIYLPSQKSGFTPGEDVQSIRHSYNGVDEITLDSNPQRKKILQSEHEIPPRAQQNSDTEFSGERSLSPASTASSTADRQRAPLKLQGLLLPTQKKKMNLKTHLPSRNIPVKLPPSGDSSLSSSIAADEDDRDSVLSTSDSLNDPVRIKSPAVTATAKNPSRSEEPAMVQEDMPPRQQDPIGSRPHRQASASRELFPNFYWPNEAQKSDWTAKTYFPSFNDNETMLDFSGSSAHKTSRVLSQLASQQLSSNNSYSASEPIDHVWSQKETGWGADTVSEPTNSKSQLASTPASAIDRPVMSGRDPWSLPTSLENKNSPYCKGSTIAPMDSSSYGWMFSGLTAGAQNKIIKQEDVLPQDKNYQIESSFFLPGRASNEEDLYSFFSPSNLYNKTPGAKGPERSSLGKSDVVEESSADANKAQIKKYEAIVKQLQAELHEKQKKEINIIRACLQERASWLRAILPVADEQIKFIRSALKKENKLIDSAITKITTRRDQLTSDLDIWQKFQTNCNLLLAQTLEKQQNVPENLEATDNFKVPTLPTCVFIVEPLSNPNSLKYDFDQAPVSADAGFKPALTDLVNEANAVTKSIVLVPKLKPGMNVVKPLRPFRNLAQLPRPAIIPTGSSMSSQFSFEKIVLKVQNALPQVSRDVISKCIDKLRRKNNGSLADFTEESLIHKIIDKLSSKEQTDNLIPALQGVDTYVANEEPKKRRMQLNEMYTKCSICFEPVFGQSIILDCHHTFHQACLQPWLKRDQSCPNCRKLVLLKEDFPSLR